MIGRAPRPARDYFPLVNSVLGSSTLRRLGRLVALGGRRRRRLAAAGEAQHGDLVADGDVAEGDDAVVAAVEEGRRELLGLRVVGASATDGGKEDAAARLKEFDRLLSRCRLGDTASVFGRDADDGAAEPEAVDERELPSFPAVDATSDTSEPTMRVVFRAVNGERREFLAKCGNLPALTSAAGEEGGGNGAWLARVPHDRQHVHFAAGHHRRLAALASSHAMDRHLLLVGPAGCGKTTLVREFASLFRYALETLYVHAEMTTRDLLQRRGTDPDTGDTTWHLSALMTAARFGRLAVIDGVDQLPPSTLAVLQSLLTDGAATLYDGSVFLPAAEFDALCDRQHLTPPQLALRGVFRVHPSFRVIATARPPTREFGKKFWLTPEVAGLFDVHCMGSMGHGNATVVLHRAGLAAAAAAIARRERADRALQRLVRWIGRRRSRRRSSSR